MAPTREERREVAERLRDYAKFRNFCPLETFFVRLNIILFGDNGWDMADGEIFERLADLIDPTCYVESVDSTGRLLAYRLSCGDTAYVDHPALRPSYCPICGARVEHQ